MENSFFEFRNETEVSLDSIDNSKSGDDSYSMLKQLKTPLKQAKAVILESEEEEDYIAEDKNDESYTKHKEQNPSSSSNEWRKSLLINNSTDSEAEIVRRRGPKKMIFNDSDDESDNQIKRLELKDKFKKSISFMCKKDTIDSDDSINKTKSDKEVIVYDSEEDMVPDDELVLPPMLRMSMTGIRPKDLSSDESFIIDYEDESRQDCEQKKFSDELKDDLNYLKLTTNENNRKVLTNNSCNMKNYDSEDDVAVVEVKHEIVNLSSDEEDSKIMQRKSTSPPKNQRRSSIKGGITIKKYMVPESHPGSRITYVSAAVRKNELNKLEMLREDLHKIRYIIENMDLDSLPDNGVKIVSRMSEIEAQVKAQAEKVAVMVVETGNPNEEDFKRNDDAPSAVKGPSWDDIKEISEQVQPKMFGKQAMNTHMAERGAIMERLRNLHDALESRPNDHTHAPMPSALRTKLMQHQAHALAWLIWRESQLPRGGILADDMGLGKTLTMIALVAASKDAQTKSMSNDDGWTGKGKGKIAKGGTLVVCPASLVRQWASEVEHHCRPRSVSTTTHHGPTRATVPRDLTRFDLVITSYNIVSRDHAKEGVLMKINWERVILDEAHVVRNHKTAAAKAVCELQTQKRWALTGTPVQNKDLDLFALLKFLRCSPFDELVLWKKWIDNKTAGGQERLSTIMRAIMLRRTKQALSAQGDLPSLPDKNFNTELVTLSKEEMNVYQKVLVLSKTLFGQFLHQRAERQANLQIGGTDAYDKLHKRMVAIHGVKPIKSHEILVLLLRLRQLCCHPGLVTGMFDGDDAATVDSATVDLMAELNKMSLDDAEADKENMNENEPDESASITEAIKTLCPKNNPVFNLDNKSSKIKAVMECLEKKIFPNKGEKAVVVSQWTSVLSLVERQLKFNKMESLKLTGSVPVAARSNIVTTFNDPNSKIRVLLLSLAAGGVGLNLCGANHLLLLDPHWNPQLEAQAQDRIYRVGQTKNVYIYRFMTVNTVEQNIRKLQDVKLELAETVLTGAKNNGATKLTIDDLKLLFNM